MDKMAGIITKNLRENPLTEVAGVKVAQAIDYTKPEETGLPSANVLIYKLEDGATVIVRPSEQNRRLRYYTTLGKDLEEAKTHRKRNWQRQ